MTSNRRVSEFRKRREALRDRPGKSGKGEAFNQYPSAYHELVHPI